MKPIVNSNQTKTPQQIDDEYKAKLESFKPLRKKAEEKNDAKMLAVISAAETAIDAARRMNGAPERIRVGGFAIAEKSASEAMGVVQMFVEHDTKESAPKAAGDSSNPMHEIGHGRGG